MSPLAFSVISTAVAIVVVVRACAEAAALLDRPAACDLGPGRPNVHDADFLDPLGFAEAIDGVDFRELFAHGAAVDMAAYKRALTAVYRGLGFVGDAPRDHPLYRPLNDLDEAALSVWSVVWMGGIRAGAAYEHLRLAMVTPWMECERCHAGGRLWGGSPFRHDGDGTNEEACPDCGGSGTVPTPAPTLASLGLGAEPLVADQRPRIEGTADNTGPAARASPTRR